MNPSMHRFTALAIAAGTAAAMSAPLPASAFEAGPGQMAADLMRVAQAELGDAQAFVAAELEAERPVKGAPYCADAVHETVQLLPDASGAITNRIVRRQQTRLCRDGEGRTRQEVEHHGQRRIYLRDPVARESWVLDPQRKTARRIGRGMPLVHDGAPMIDHSAWQDFGERMREWARGVAERSRSAAGRGEAHPTPPTPPTPPAAPAPVAGATPVVIAPGDGVQVRVLRSGDAPPLPDAPLPLAWRATQLAPRGPATVTALGSKDIDGLRAGGERSTWTIEAGKLGNEKPIHISREVWRSPDLLLTLSATDFDPRSGETRYRLHNLKRGEPDAALMQVPADYTKRGGSAPAAPSAPASSPRGRG